MAPIILNGLKFLALGIGAAAGVIGTVTDTRNPANGKLTRHGKILVALIVASGVVAGITQSIELYLQGVAAESDRAQRLQEFEALYALTHPLGDLRVQVNVTYPIEGGIGGLDNTWLARVRQGRALQAATERRLRDARLPDLSRTYAVLNDSTDPLRPSPTRGRESREYSLLVVPEIDFTLNKTPSQQPSDSTYLRDHGAQLGFRTGPGRSLIYVHFAERKVDNQIYAPTLRLHDDGSILSWRDLYGAELIVKLPDTAPAGARITRCTLTFSNGAVFGARMIEVPFTDVNRRANPGSEPFSHVSYVHVLTEAELGPKPIHLQERSNNR